MFLDITKTNEYKNLALGCIVAIDSGNEFYIVTNMELKSNENSVKVDGYPMFY